MVEVSPSIEVQFCALTVVVGK